jgi:hypothetical protein
MDGRGAAWIRVRALSLLLLFLHLAGCTTIQPAVGDPSEIIASQRPSKAELRKSDGSSVLIADPQVVGDTIEGHHIIEGRESGFLSRTSVDDVTALALPQRDTKRTVLLGAVLTTVVLLGLPLLAYSLGYDK